MFVPIYSGACLRTFRWISLTFIPGWHTVEDMKIAAPFEIMVIWDGLWSSCQRIWCEQCCTALLASIMKYTVVIPTLNLCTAAKDSTYVCSVCDDDVPVNRLMHAAVMVVFFPPALFRFDMYQVCIPHLLLYDLLFSGKAYAWYDIQLHSLIIFLCMQTHHCSVHCMTCEPLCVELRCFNFLVFLRVISVAPVI